METLKRFGGFSLAGIFIGNRLNMKKQIVRIGLLFFFSLLVTFFGCQPQKVSREDISKNAERTEKIKRENKPIAPLIVNLSGPKTGFVSGQNTLVLTIQPLIDSDVMRIEWELPDGISLVEGETSFMRHIISGQIENFSLKVLIHDEKRYEVKVWVRLILDNGKEISQGATLIIDIGEPEKVVKPFRSETGSNGEGIIEYQGIVEPAEDKEGER